MYKGDEAWVKKKINELSEIKIKILAWECYKKKYNEVFESEVIEHRKQGAARFAANSALRIYVKKVIESNKSQLV